MSFDSIDYRRIRAQTEERLRPLLHLQQARTRLAVYGLALVLFLLANSVIWQWDMTGYVTWSDYRAMMHYYTAFMLGMVLLVTLFAIQSGRLWLSFRRESLIQRELKSDLELERLRLQSTLYGQHTKLEMPDVLEKPKRVTILGDDGELRDDELAQEQTHSRANHQTL